ncbi:MAG: ABC transporter permease [Betaproteobacteria bacterium]|nr:ABC transporter permease [Betaproteobacteria bacterium]
MTSRARLARWALSGPPLTFLAIFFLIPTLIMALASFGWPGREGGFSPLWYHDAAGWHFDFTLGNYRDIFTLRLFLVLYLRSLGYALATTGFCLVGAYPLSLVIARARVGYRNLLLLLVIVPFWSNFLIRIYAWMIILGPQAALSRGINAVLGLCGIRAVNLLFSPFAVMMGLVYVSLPFMILPLYANLEKHDPALLEAARDLGASAWSCFWRVTFPLSVPGVIAGATLVFVPALGAFAVPDILGGTRGIMIGNVIEMEFLQARDWPFGAALSIILTILALGATGIAAWAARRGIKAYG